MKQKFYIETYGCQMNVYDSELVANLLYQSGYEKTEDIAKADAVFLNTCAIREKAEDTVHNRLDNFKHLKKKKPDMLIGLLGCMAQHLKNDLFEQKPYVDVILGPDSYRKLPEIINSRQRLENHIVDTTLSRYEIYEDLFPSRASGINAWISISRGCDKFCTFCIVPFTRGRERSRSIDSIVTEARKAVAEGYPEITLLGQNVNSFRTEQGNFPELLKAVAQIKGLERIRFTSPHPQDVDDHMLQVMQDYPNICNHIHLPLQAGSDKILKRMNRTYDKAHFLDLVKRIKQYLPDCSLSTDIIVGFPGETENEFLETLEVVSEVTFDSAFMFKYSMRPGTKAAEYTDQVKETTKQERLERLIQLQKKTSLQAIGRHIGTVQRVLVEKESKKSDHQWAGRTEGNTWAVWDKTSEVPRQMVNIKIIDAKGITLFGKRID